MLDDDPTDTTVDAAVPSTTPEHLVLAERYRIEAILGRGGMGSVYRAHDTWLDERVAIKVLHLTEGGDAGFDAVRSEVKLARRVTHPNVARTFDVATHDRLALLTMEYVDGPSLAAALRTGEAKARAASLVQSIALGLAAIHAASVVHADLKPENVLLTASGVPKITDFGIARAAFEGSLGDRLRWAGTKRYMAPEQAGGAPADERTDLFSFGVLVHEIFSGVRSRASSDSDESAFAAGLPPLPPSTPQVVREIAAECVSFHRGARPISAAAIVERFSSGLPASVTTPGAALPATPLLGRRMIAVAPFDAATPAAEDIAAALSAETLRLLGSADGISVTRVRSVAVEATVRGTVAVRDDGLRVGLRLVSEGEELLVWSAAFASDNASAIVHLDACCNDMARALATRTRRRVGALPHPSTATLYLRAIGLAHAWRGSDREAVTCIEEALAIRPDDVRLLATYAIVLARRHPSPDAPLAAARAASNRAMAAAPDDADTHTATAFVRFMENDLAAAAHAAHRAVALAPSTPTAHSVLGAIAAEVGLVEVGLESLNMARALDPLASIAGWAAARAHELIGDFAACDELLAADGAATNHDLLHQLLRARISMWRRQRVDVHLPALALIATVEPGARDAADAACEVLVGFMRDPDRLRQRATLRQTCIELRLVAGDLDAAERDLEKLADVDLSSDVLWSTRCPLLRALDGRPATARAQGTIASRAAAVAGELRPLLVLDV